MADIDEVKPTHPALPARRIEKDKRRRDVEEQKPRKQPPRREDGDDDGAHVDEYV